MRDLNKRYRKIAGNQVLSIDNMKIRTHVPSISDRDLKRGYITRHFVRKLNDESSYIFEVDREELSRIHAFPTYLTVSLDWRITGTKQEIMESNQRSVKQASKSISTISLYLPNYKQFAQPSDK